MIDAAYGTGYRARPDRLWRPPEIGAAAVLAVDVPSGTDALTGGAGSRVLRADRTVTFQALKPGLLLGRGATLARALRRRPRPNIRAPSRPGAHTHAVCVYRRSCGCSMRAVCVCVCARGMGAI